MVPSNEAKSAVNLERHGSRSRTRSRAECRRGRDPRRGQAISCVLDDGSGHGAEGAGLAGGMLTIDAAGVGISRGERRRGRLPGRGRGRDQRDSRCGLRGPGRRGRRGPGRGGRHAETANAGGRVRVGPGTVEPVGTGVAAGGVAPTPVTAGIGESAPGVGMGDEGTGVGVTRASRGCAFRLNGHSSPREMATLDRGFGHPLGGRVSGRRGASASSPDPHLLRVARRSRWLRSGSQRHRSRRGHCAGGRGA